VAEAQEQPGLTQLLMVLPIQVAVLVEEVVAVAQEQAVQVVLA
jgi:hypothetical protein